MLQDFSRILHLAGPACTVGEGKQICSLPAIVFPGGSVENSLQKVEISHIAADVVHDRKTVRCDADRTHLFCHLFDILRKYAGKGDRIFPAADIFALNEDGPAIAVVIGVEQGIRDRKHSRSDYMPVFSCCMDFCCKLSDSFLKIGRGFFLCRKEKLCKRQTLDEFREAVRKHGLDLTNLYLFQGNRYPVRLPLLL